MTSVAARSAGAVTAASAAASLGFAPWRGTPLAAAGDIAFAALLVASLTLLAGRPRALRRDGAFWGLALAGLVLQGSVPLLGWSPRPPALAALALGSAPTAGVALAAGLSGGAAFRIARTSPRRDVVVLLTVAAFSLVAASVLERERVHRLRQGATAASVSALRNVESALRTGTQAPPSVRDGWGWLIRVEGSGERLRITSPGAGGRFEPASGRGPITSWEDDLVLGRDQAWERWPPTGNAPGAGTPAPWRDWRTPRWR